VTARITEVPDPYDARRWRLIVKDIENRFAKVEQMAGPYTISNFTPTRTLNMGTATATDIGNFLATLVSDLQAIGRLSKP
jgi:hypothetical protein